MGGMVPTRTANFFCDRWIRGCNYKSKLTSKTSLFEGGNESRSYVRCARKRIVLDFFCYLCNNLSSGVSGGSARLTLREESDQNATYHTTHELYLQDRPPYVFFGVCVTDKAPHVPFRVCGNINILPGVPVLYTALKLFLTESTFGLVGRTISAM